MTTPYSRGYQFELKVKAYLESLGYTVFRVAGSHGPADLIALMSYSVRDGRITNVWLIQCQRGKYFSKDKKGELEELADKVNAHSVLAWSEDARKRGNTAIRFSDDAIITSAPEPPRTVEVGG